MISIDGKQVDNLQIFTTDLVFQYQMALDNADKELATQKDITDGLRTTNNTNFAKIASLEAEIVGLKSIIAVSPSLTVIDELNAEIVRLKAIIAGTPPPVVVPPPVVPPVTEPAALFIGKMASATITPYGGGATLQPWYDDLIKLGFPEFGFQTSNQYVKNEMLLENNVKVLRAEIIGADPGDAGRFQGALYYNKTQAEYHHSIRMKFGAGIAGISNYSGPINSNSGDAWFTAFETWIGQSESRMNLSLNKAGGVGMPITWELDCEWEEGSSTPYRNVWPTQFNTSPVPIDKWFTMEVYIKSGAGANGQIKITITPDGEPAKVIFDVKNTTNATIGTAYRRKTDFMKFYIGKSLRSFMLTAGKKMEVFYGDLKIFKY